MLQKYNFLIEFFFFAEVSLHSGIGYREKLFHVTMAYQRQAISQEFLDDINKLNSSLEG